MIYTKKIIKHSICSILRVILAEAQETLGASGLFITPRFYRIFQWIRFCHITLLTTGHEPKNFTRCWGLMLLQSFDLTDKEAIKQFAFNFEWHYALGIKDKSDKSTYASEKLFEHARHLLTENDLYQSLFDIPTRQLADLCGVDPSRQQLDSCTSSPTCATSSGSVLFVRIIKKFLQYLKANTPGLADSADSRKPERSLFKQGRKLFFHGQAFGNPKTMPKTCSASFGTTGTIRK